MNNNDMEWHKGNWCPHTPLFCQEGYCTECEIFKEYKEKNIDKFQDEVKK